MDAEDPDSAIAGMPSYPLDDLPDAMLDATLRYKRLASRLRDQLSDGELDPELAETLRLMVAFDIARADLVRHELDMVREQLATVSTLLNHVATLTSLIGVSRTHGNQ